MKPNNLFISVMIAFSFPAFCSCTEYITIKTENPDNPTGDNSKPSNDNKDPAEVLFNTTWKQVYAYVNPGDNPQITNNIDAYLEFSDIKYMDTGKYIIKHDSEPIGLYSMEGNKYITLDWYTIDPENGEKYSNLYGEGQFRIHISNHDMNYSRYYSSNGVGYIDYYYDKIPEK